MSESLAEALPREQQRVRDLLRLYESIPSGAFAAAMMKESLARAERAAAAGDLQEMLVAYQDLQGYSD